jgi:flagellar biosynthesis/type III secretory pathway protein FliH
MTVGEHEAVASEIAQQSSSPDSGEVANLRNYRPAPYEPVAWPVVSATTKDEAFSPLSYERVSERRYVVDPMFANFDQELVVIAEPQKERDVATFISESPENMNTASTEDPLLSEDEHSEVVEEGFAEEVAIEVVAETQVLDLQEDGSAHSASDDAHEGSEVEPPTTAQKRQPPKKQVESAEFEERVEREVQKRIAAAQEEREQMLAQVQQVAYTKAREDAMQEYSARFETLVDDTRTQVAETCRDCEQQAVDLAFQIAKKLLGSIVADHREYIHEVIAEALKAAGNAEIQCVRVSPQDYEFLGTSQTPEKTWKLESDDSIGAGCIVVTSTGDVDFDLEKSWARMREKVTRGPKS